VCVSYALQPGGGSCLATFQEQDSDATAARAGVPARGQPSGQGRSLAGGSSPARSAQRGSPAARSIPPFDGSAEPLVDYLLAP
jgi:hypothetical protein